MSAPAPALYHALRAELAIVGLPAGLRLEALADAANRAMPYFKLNAADEVESLSDETISDFLAGLKFEKPFYFHRTKAHATLRPPRALHGKVGDRLARTRLAYSNEIAA